MKNRYRLTSIALFLTACIASAPGASARSLSAHSPNALAWCSVELTAKWIVDRADNICGLDDPRMLSRPAKLDYDSLLAATPEMKKLRDDKVEPNSSEGIQLRQKAVDRVRNAADKVRQSEGHCSIWKTIRHSDARTIPDVTDLVRAQM